MEELAKTKQGIKKLEAAKDALGDRIWNLEAYRAVFTHSERSYNRASWANPTSLLSDEEGYQQEIREGSEVFDEHYIKPIREQWQLVTDHIPDDGCSIM